MSVVASFSCFVGSSNANVLLFIPALVSASPMTVQLQFEPAGRPNEDRRYYLKQKENICVVCGTEKNCVRKNIVPHEYRKYVSR